MSNNTSEAKAEGGEQLQGPDVVAPQEKEQNSGSKKNDKLDEHLNVNPSKEAMIQRRDSKPSSKGDSGSRSGSGQGQKNEKDKTAA